MEPVIRLTDLVPDACNFKDQTFQKDVRRFMEKFMPSFPLGLLEVSDWERWEVESPGRLVEFTLEWSDGELTIEVQDDRFEGALFQTFSTTVTGLVESDKIDFTKDEHADEGPMIFWAPVDADDDIICDDYITDCQDDAESHLRDWQEGKQFGYPWANNTVYQPDERITVDELQAAGFVVASYTGGDNDAYRLCGIDGGGYSFEGQHFAKLYAIVASNREWPVETDNGPHYITSG